MRQKTSLAYEWAALVLRPLLEGCMFDCMGRAMPSVRLQPAVTMTSSISTGGDSPTDQKTEHEESLNVVLIVLRSDLYVEKTSRWRWRSVSEYPG